MSIRVRLLRPLGFSLIEFIVVIVVLGIVASMGAVVVRNGILGYLRGREITGSDGQGRLALERITRELRTIASPNYSNITAGSCGTSTFSFSDLTATPISYTLPAGSTTLLRNGYSLVENIGGLRFYCLQSDGQTYSTAASAAYYVSVSMVVSTTNTSSTYRSTVRPRNFP